MTGPWKAAALTAGLLVLTTGAASAAETIRVGACVSWPGYSYIPLAQEKGLTGAYDVQVTILEDPLAGHAMLAAGQLDVYACTVDYTPVAIEQDLPVALVAFTNPSYGVDQVVLAPGIAPKDLAGKKVSAPEAYIGALLVGTWLDLQGIAVDQVSWVNLNSDEAVGPMLSGDLAAAYMYEPWISKLIENLPGATSVANTAQPEFLKTGMFSDGLYMNTDFIKNRRQAALDILKARWEGLGYWHENTAEANEVIARYLDWPVADVESVIGSNGQFAEGGNFMLSFNEAARFCGVLDGEPPLGLRNGGAPDAVRRINEWWIKLGLMREMHDPAQGIDCSLMEELVAQGYRQEF